MQGDPCSAFGQLERSACRDSWHRHASQFSTRDEVLDDEDTLIAASTNHDILQWINSLICPRDNT